MNDVVAVIIVVLMFLITIHCNSCLTYLLEEYIYEKCYLNREKEDEEYDKTMF